MSTVSQPPALHVEDLRVRLDTDDGVVYAVNGLSFSLQPGEVLAVVGESGCGKSMTAMALMDLLPANAQRTGHVQLAGEELTAISHRAMGRRRGKDLSMIFQEPMTSLNPAFTVGFQISEVLRRHTGLGRRAARRRAAELLARVGIPAATQRLDEYAHQLSGGMRQRVMIAMAIACDPRVLIADEPTTALDVTIQAQILDILRHLAAETGTAVILITHNLGVVADIADRVMIMYAGHLIESAPVHELFAAPQHPYTQGLLGAVPRTDRHALGEDTTTRLAEIPGRVPVLRAPADSCVFAPRCPRAADDCYTAQPPLEAVSATQRVACCYPGFQEKTYPREDFYPQMDADGHR